MVIKFRVVWASGRGISCVIAFQCFDEGFGDAVALGRTNRGGGKPQSKRCRGCGCFPGNIGVAIVGQPFDGVRRLCSAKAPLDSLDHQIARHFARYARMGDGGPGDDCESAWNERASCCSSHHVIDRSSKFCWRSSGGGRRDRRALAWDRMSCRSRSERRMIQGAPLQCWLAGRGTFGDEPADGGRAEGKSRGRFVEYYFATGNALALTVNGDIILTTQ